jgi:hypothetical protein
LAALLMAALAGGGALAQGRVTFASPEQAFENGMGAYRAGHLEIAIPALEAAAAKNIFLAQYYLARIYADSNSGAHTNHAKAYKLYQRIADEHADIDPDDDRRAPFVAKAFVALSRYLQIGLRGHGVAPDPSRAMELARHAAIFFNDEDAQFELAKLQLQAEASPQDVRSAIHFLSVLTQKRHPSAQALLADLHWRGKFVNRDPLTALSLISVAVENAPPADRIWIEDIHQNIFCGAPEGMRQQARGKVLGWQDKYGRKDAAPSVDRSGLPLAARAPRSCGNGEPVKSLLQEAMANAKPAAPGATQPVPPMIHGTTLVPGLREIGTPAPQQPSR